MSDDPPIELYGYTPNTTSSWVILARSAGDPLFVSVPELGDAKAS